MRQPARFPNPLVKIWLEAGFPTAEKAARACKCSRIHLLTIGQGKGNPSDELVSIMAKQFNCTRVDIRDAVRLAQKRLHKSRLKALGQGKG